MLCEELHLSCPLLDFDGYKFAGMGVGVGMGMGVGGGYLW